MGSTTFNGILRSGAGGSKPTMQKGVTVLSTTTLEITAAMALAGVFIYMPAKIFMSAVYTVKAGGALPSAGTLDMTQYSDDKSTITAGGIAIDEIATNAAALTSFTDNAVWIDAGQSMFKIENGATPLADGSIHLRIQYFQHDGKYGANG